MAPIKKVKKKVTISHHIFRYSKAYVVGDGSWRGANYPDIYEAEKFKKFLLRKL